MIASFFSRLNSVFTKDWLVRKVLSVLFLNVSLPTELDLAIGNLLIEIIRMDYCRRVTRNFLDRPHQWEVD